MTPDPDPPARRTLLVVWHSSTGAARQLAQAAADAARERDCVHVRILRCDEVDAATMLACDGYLFACPEMLGSMSGAMKDLFDRCYYALLDRVVGRPYAAIVAAGSDGQGAARQIVRIATGWRLREVAPPTIVCTQAQTPEAILAPKTVSPADREEAAALGAGLAEGLALGIW